MSSNIAPLPVHKDLFLIALPVPMKGFEGFITSWVYTGGPVVIVDVGPSSSAAFLLDALGRVGVRRPDLILLTHIHIDHAGGIGEIAQAFAHTPVVCHPMAAEHLIDPQKLWEGSLKSLGAVAQHYGPIAPVKRQQVMHADQIEGKGIAAIPTPGHAPHHFSYLIDNLLFAGEAGGVCLSMGNGAYYMRAATPPRLHLDTYLDSINRLIAHAPKRICYGHIGMQNNAVAMLQTHHDQLLRWRQLIRPWFERDPQNTRHSMTACLAHLLASDPLLSGFSKLPASAQERERFFLKNSVRGYWGYFADLARGAA